MAAALPVAAASSSAVVPPVTIPPAIIQQQSAVPSTSSTGSSSNSSSSANIAAAVATTSSSASSSSAATSQAGASASGGAAAAAAVTTADVATAVAGAVASTSSTSNSPDVEDIEKKESETTSLEEFPPELLIKHPLQNTWTLWYYEQEKNKSWEESQREITSFDTAEDFWSLYNHIKQASELKQGCDYSMFKQGVRPMWEDDANKNGGRWLLNLEKKQRTTDLDNFWLEILLCMIGEGFNEYSDDVCGAVVNVRPRVDKIAVWTGDAGTQASVMEIGRKLKERLRITPKLMIGYQVHRDTMVKQGSSAKNTYVI